MEETTVIVETELTTVVVSNTVGLPGAPGPAGPQGPSGSGADWGNIGGTLSDQTDLQAALDGKQDLITGSNLKMLYKDLSGIPKSFEAMEINSRNGINYSLSDSFEDSDSHSVHSDYVQFIPTENSPDTSIANRYTEMHIDPNDDGLSFGSNGNALDMFANYFRAEGSGDIGNLTFTNNSFVIGNGTDPIDLRGLSYAFGFGEIKSGVSILNAIQGYGFQPTVRSGAIVDSAAYVQAFYDSMSYEGESSYHTSFNSSPSIQTIPGSRNYTGFNINPNIVNIADGAGINGINISGTYGTFSGNAYFQGINVNPTIASSKYAAGIQVSMDNVTPYVGVKASVTIQDLTFEFVEPGSFNNTYSIEFVSGGTAGSEVVAILNQTIEIQIESGVSTATQIKQACDNALSFAASVTTTISGTASNPQVADGPENFSGGIDAGRVLAAWLDGDVEITGDLTFGGALSIGKLNAFSSQAIINNPAPSSVHSLISSPTVADNVTVTNADTIAVNTAALINIGTNSSVSTSFVGIASLGLPAVLTMGAGSTVDRIYGALFALSLDAAAAGGTVDEMGLCRAVAIPNGSTTLNSLYGFLFDLPFGDPGTKTFGFYDRPGKNNYFAGTLLIGGTPGSDDVVTNSNVALEIKSSAKAFLNARMTETQRDALTAVNGMQVYNTTANKLQVYASGAWADLH